MSLPNLRPHHLEGKENQPVMVVVENHRPFLENGLVLLRYSEEARLWYYKVGTSAYPLITHWDVDVDGPYYPGFYAIPDELTT